MWEQIGGWVVLGGIVAAVFVGRKLTQRKTGRIKAEAYAQGMRDLRIQMGQQVIVHGDDRRTLVVGGDRPAVEPAADDRTANEHTGPVRRVVRDGDRRRELVPGWPGPAVVPGVAGDGPVGALGPAGLNEDSLAVAVLGANEDDSVIPLSPTSPRYNENRHSVSGWWDDE